MQFDQRSEGEDQANHNDKLQDNNSLKLKKVVSNQTAHFSTNTLEGHTPLETPGGEEYDPLSQAFEVGRSQVNNFE